MLTVASLCSGYGGLEMGLRAWLGELEVTWHAEANADAERVLKTHWPRVPNRGDFTLPDFWADAPRADLHAGGVPCQPFSQARNTRRRGVEDHRYLWPYWLEGIRLHRPASVVFENVQNLAYGKLRPVLDMIISDLVGLGYDVRWCVFGACMIGACHHRHRVFLLACRTRSRASARQTEVQTCADTRAAYLPTPRARDYKGPETGHRLERGMHGGYDLTAALNLLPVPWSPEAFAQYAPRVARHAEVMGTPPPAPIEVGPKGGRRLTAAFSEWMMMLPAGHVTDVLDRRSALQRCGNGVVPLQAAQALRLLFDDLSRS